ncbi:MAG: rod shape-determining protein RodA [Solirubrobacterales bacterium]
MDPRPARIADWTRIPQMDPLLLLGVAGLIAVSIVTLALTTQDDVAGNPYFFVIRQSMYVIVGVTLMLAAARVDYSRFRELRVGLYWAMIAGILLVLALGSATRGSRRWLELPFFTFQPSEMGKVLLILALSAFAIDQARRISDRRRTARLLLLGLLPAGLIFLQPDFGTALVYIAITGGILLIAGVRWTHFAAIGGVALAAIVAILVIAPAAGTPVLQDYQVERITTFLNPSEDSGDSSYQINQALTAVGSGGKTGRGEQATQTELGFLPETRTDFIFAVVAERWGLMGAAVVLSLYALLIWRALRILTISKNLYGSLIAAGVVSMLMFQVFVNVGMTLGLMPITGLTLPLMSFGGSSVLSTFLAIGVLQSVFVQAQRTTGGRAQPLM